MSSPPPAPQPPDARPLPPEAFHRWYGGWDPLDPSSTAALMDGFDRPWWIIGGWVIERFTGRARPHEDMDISILSGDAERFREFLGDRWTPWNVDDGWFRPYDGRFGPIRPDSQIWVRPDAQSPWILDVPLTPERDGQWTNKRIPEQSAPLEEVTWTAADGLLYLNPEIVLLMKAKQNREKDRVDAEVTLPMLERHQRDWLRAALHLHRPEHPWLERL